MSNQKWKSPIAENKVHNSYKIKNAVAYGTDLLEEIKYEKLDKLSKSQSTIAALAFPKLL